MPIDPTLHIELVRKLALYMKRWHLRDSDVEELIGDGMIGLMDAIRTYDTARGCTFETHAGRKIKWAMLDGYNRMEMVKYKRRREGDAVVVHELDAPVREDRRETWADQLPAPLQDIDTAILWFQIYRLCTYHQRVFLDYVRAGNTPQGVAEANLRTSVILRVRKQV